MVRIASVNLPKDKTVEAALPYLYVIGWSLSKKILAQLKINPGTIVKDLSETEANKIREYIEKNYKVDGDLKR